MRKLVYLVAVTIDGYIADVDGDYSFFGADPEFLRALFAEYPETCPAPAREPLGVTAGPRHFDTVVMGRATMQPALDSGLGSPYPHLRQIVFSRDPSTVAAGPDVTVTSDDPVATVRELKHEDGLDMWLCGGHDLASQLVDEIDEFHLKVNPVILGTGIPFLTPASGLTHLTPISSARLGDIRIDSYSRTSTTH